ncbi:MAG: hypothetical protein J0I48_08385 [Devosia sp.]|uniref:hypothetical protein n=1 Tax=Devosia sp. 66-22 TaxID=1895753 RepID=UPI000927FE36|nr:hypothetical protein [Devosia sp. 66-22]MBN9346204.1 hypothetical protein [Devosia sp.]OJX49067.1 MAG: hypothetical protein BGO81_10800 [Devosia sp. 66-22]
MNEDDDLERELAEDREYFRRRGTLHDPSAPKPLETISKPKFDIDYAINGIFVLAGAVSLMVGGVLVPAGLVAFGALIWLQSGYFPTWPLMTWYPVPYGEWVGLNQLLQWIWGQPLALVMFVSGWVIGVTMLVIGNSR